LRWLRDLFADHQANQVTSNIPYTIDRTEFGIEEFCFS
jgi:hypothetical protein